MHHLKEGLSSPLNQDIEGNQKLTSKSKDCFSLFSTPVVNLGAINELLLKELQDVSAAEENNCESS